MLASFGNRSAYDKTPGSFTPYFQYKIGPYQPDQYLYFPKEPFAILYKNEIFNKLLEYSGYDIIRYLEFHYSAYPVQMDFLRFLNYEIFERLKKLPKNTGLLSAQAWVSEKTEELKKEQKDQIKHEVGQAVKEIVDKHPAASPREVNAYVSALVDKFMERASSELERGIKDLTGSFVTGNIELNNRNHEEKLIQMFILIQQVQAPAHIGKGEQLFKKFTASDIASILHLHFEAYKDNKINTLQRKVGDQAERIKTTNLKVKKLNEALQEFFY